MTGRSEPSRPISLHTERHGSGGPPLLLIHGFGASGFSWRFWVPELARSHDVWVADLKGFGASPKPRDGRYSPHDHAELVLELILAEGLDDLTLIGHSLGGGVSLLVALRLLDAGALGRLRSLVLVSGAAYRQPLPPFVSAAGKPALGSLLLALLPIRALVRRVLWAIVHDRRSVTEEMVRGYAGPLSGRDARYGLLATARAIIPPDVSELTRRFPELDLPVHLLWGDDDRVVPPWVGERLQADLPKATLHTLPRCGHLPAEEHPQESLASVTRFLDALPARR